jgi:hypothetical protein
MRASVFTLVLVLLCAGAAAADDGASHYRHGVQLMDNGGDLDQAIQEFERARELGFQPLGAAYRLSRIYARTGRDGEALDQIEIMARGGFNMPELIEVQPDYAAIKDDPRFVAALESFRAARFPCKADENRHAFDFWIGKWNVTQDGQFAGTNDIQPILGHCVLLEQWESATGQKGKSFNYYDPGKKHWRQVWISDTGSVVEYTGEARDGGMYFTAETVDPTDGSVTDHKFEFTRYDNGDVRQLWQTSTDGGKTWTTIWDGRYARQAE